MSLPTNYQWLQKETAPRMLVEALKFYGLEEKAGTGSNPVILAWGKELRLPYTDDSIPWCGLFMAIIAKRANKTAPPSPLWARNWEMFGNPTYTAKLGDVLVFSRDGGGHVGLYVGEDTECFYVLGGNQGDKVSIVRIRKSRLLAIRNSYINQPSSCRPVYLSASGLVSANEV